MRGHATPDEEAYVVQLENKTDPNSSSIEQIMELAILYIDPCHEEEKAMDLFNAVLKIDSGNNRAKLWLAYCYIWYLLDYNKAKLILEDLLDIKSTERAAAYMLMAYSLERLNQATVREQIHLLEESVALEPDWGNNHSALAWAYQDANRLPDAIMHLRQAIANIVPPDPNWGFARQTYENQITGRLGHTEFLNSQLAKMEDSM